MIRARLTVELKDAEGNVIDEVNGKVASGTREFIMDNDGALKQLKGDEGAKVGFVVQEKIGGPYGYSSVTVGVSVTLTCDQSESAVQKAGQESFRIAADMLDNTIGASMKMLLEHLKEHYAG